MLFTGASGFLGLNILPLLLKDYATDTIGLSDKDTYNVDLSENIIKLNRSYDLVLHAAGKAHVIPKNKYENEEFYKVNYQGTVNLCKSLEKVGVPKSFIFISTVAVYGIEKGLGITEEHELLGSTPYALSKIMAENYLKKWCKRNNVVLGILRPSLIAGKNPPGNLGKMIEGIRKGQYFNVRKGKARKSILMAEDIAILIPKIAKVGGVYNICDNHHPSFNELGKMISNQLKKRPPISIPYWLAKSVAILGDIFEGKIPLNSVRLEKMVNSLTFSNEKAKKQLNWEPLDVLANFKIY